MIFDRILNKKVCKDNLPKGSIDLGRYCIINENDEINEITNTSNNWKSSNDQYIKQDLLTNPVFSSTQKYLEHIHNSLYSDLWEQAVPIIQKFQKEINPSKFEKLLLDENKKILFHLKHIAREPQSKLDRTLVKVHVSRCKRITHKSYDYLSSHTEDWEMKNLLGFKPNRILSEELDVDYNIYENQLLYKFLHKSLEYLRKRLYIATDIENFEDLYINLCEDSVNDNMWGDKIDRNLTLMNSIKVPKKTELRRLIEKLIKDIKIILSSEMFSEIKGREAMSVEYHDTNILTNDPHYKCLKEAWDVLKKDNPDLSLKEKRIKQQDIFKHLRSYAKSIIIYIFRKYFKYNIIRDVSRKDTWIIEPNHNDIKIELSESKQGIIKLKIDDKIYDIVIIGNDIINKEKELPKDKYVFIYSKRTIKTKRTASINILDPDSVERVAIFIREFLLRTMVKKIKSEYKYGPIWKGYENIVINYIPWIKFNVKKQSYKLISGVIPPISNENEQDMRKLCRSERFKKAEKLVVQSPEYLKKKENQRKEFIKGFDAEIRKTIVFSSNLRKAFLYCNNPMCSKNYYDWELNSLEHIKCSCGFVIDIKDDEHIMFYLHEEKQNKKAQNTKKQLEKKIEEIQNNKTQNVPEKILEIYDKDKKKLDEDCFRLYYWGMDYIDFEL